MCNIYSKIYIKQSSLEGMQVLNMESNSGATDQEAKIFRSERALELICCKEASGFCAKKTLTAYKQILPSGNAFQSENDVYT